MLVLDASIRATADLHKLPIVAVFYCGNFLNWTTVPAANADIRRECNRLKAFPQFLPNSRDVALDGFAWRLALPKGYEVADSDCNIDFCNEIKLDSRQDGDINGEPFYEPVLLTDEVRILFRGDDTPTLPLAVLRCEKSDPSCCVEATVQGELVRVDWVKGEAVYRCEVVP